MAEWDASINIDVGTELNVESLDRTTRKLAADFDKLIGSTVGKNTSIRFKQLTIAADKLTDKMADLHKQMEDIEFNYKPSEELVEMIDNAKRLKAEYKELREMLEERLRTSTSETPEIQSLRKSVELAKLEFESAAHAAANFAEVEVNTQVDKYYELASALRDANNEAVILRQQMVETGEATLRSGASAALHKLAQAAKVAGIKILELARNIGSVLLTALKFLASHAKTAVANLLKMGATRIRDGLKKLIATITGLNSKFNLFKHQANGASSGVRNFIKAAIGIGSLMALFNKIRGAIRDGLGALAEASPSFNQTLADFKASLESLRNSFGAAFAPIASVVLPALTALINKLAEAINMIGMFIATLLGRKTYMRAVTGASGVSDAIGGVGGSAADANEEAKELQKTLAGFDDINILQSDKNNSSGGGSGGGGGGGAGGGGGFEEVAIGDEFTDLAQMFREAWENADFTDIGRLVGEKLKGALESIPWDDIKETLRKVAKSIATFLNGFLETPGLFTEIGETVAEAINSAFEFLDEFVWNFHWDSLGNAIKDFVVGAADNLDWPTIKSAMNGLARGIAEALNESVGKEEFWTAVFNTLAERTNTIVSSFKTFFTTANWADIGSAIAAGINSGIQRINWEELGATIGTAVSSLVTLFINWVTRTDWLSLGESIGRAITSSIQNTEWSKFGSAAAGALNGLVQFLKGLVSQVDFEALAHGIAEAIVTFFKEVNWEEFAGTLKSVLASLGTFFSTLATDLDLKGLGTAIMQDLFDAITQNAELQFVWWSTAFPGHLYNAIAEGINTYLIPKLESLFNTLLDPWDLLPDIELPLLPTIKDPDLAYAAAKAVIEQTSEKNHVMLWAEALGKKFTDEIPQAQKDLSTTAIAKEMRDERSNKSLDTEAKFTKSSSILTAAQRTFTSIANFKSPINNLTSAQRTFTSRADFKYSNNNIPSAGRTFPSRANFQYITNNLSSAQRTFPSRANINSYVNNLGTPALASQASFKWYNPAFTRTPEVEAIAVLKGVRSDVRGYTLARGGVFKPGSGWGSIPQYAKGSLYGGSVFVAGEAGPEVVGHIGGRTEVLNKSQIASAMYSAIISAMSNIVNTIRTVINQQSILMSGVAAELSTLFTSPIPVIIDTRTIDNLVSRINLPDVVTGRIVPMETRLSNIENRIASGVNTSDVTVEDLRNIRDDIIRAINGVEFYIGDEQIARHANYGNQKIDRRYNPVMRGVY